MHHSQAPDQSFFFEIFCVIFFPVFFLKFENFEFFLKNLSKLISLKMFQNTETFEISQTD